MAPSRLPRRSSGLVAAAAIVVIAILAAAAVIVPRSMGPSAIAVESANPSSVSSNTATPTATVAATVTATDQPTSAPTPRETGTAIPTDSPTAVPSPMRTATPTKAYTGPLFDPGDGWAASSSASLLEGGTGWYQIPYAGSDAKCTVTVLYPSGRTVTASGPKVIGVNLRWTFSVPADAGAGEATLSAACTGNGHSGVGTVNIPLTAPQGTPCASCDFLVETDSVVSPGATLYLNALPMASAKISSCTLGVTFPGGASWVGKGKTSYSFVIPASTPPGMLLASVTCYFGPTSKTHNVSVQIAP